jgi:hypothetical protein
MDLDSKIPTKKDIIEEIKVLEYIIEERQGLELVQNLSGYGLQLIIKLREF